MPGLAAKPVIDMSVVVPTEAVVLTAIERLAGLGYVHLGNLGVEGRDAFAAPDGWPRHNLYVCPRDSPGLANHLVVRDYLRAQPVAAKEYGELKKRLAREFTHDIDAYIDGKTDFILEILRTTGFRPEQLQAIEHANRNTK